MGSGGRFGREDVMQLTPKLVSRCVLCPVYIGCRSPGGITDADMETHNEGNAYIRKHGG